MRNNLILRKLLKSLLKAKIDSCFFSDWFTVRGNNLLLSNFSLDYETTPEINVTIEATDNGSLPYSKEVCFNAFLFECSSPRHNNYTE